MWYIVSHENHTLSRRDNFEQESDAKEDGIDEDEIDVNGIDSTLISLSEHIRISGDSKIQFVIARRYYDIAEIVLSCCAKLS